MSEEEKNLAHALIDTPDELDDLRDWWQKHGNGITTALCVVLAAVLAYNWYDRHKEAKAAKASMAYGEAASADDLEALVANYKSTAIAPFAQLQLGSQHYQRQKYGPAMDAYEAFLRDYPKHEFAPVAILGIAHVAEAQGKFADAETRFRDFATGYPEHYMTPLALLGQARCVALQDRRDEARAILDRMMADRAGTPWAGFADDLLAALPRLEHATLEPASSFTDALKALEGQVPAGAETNAPASEPAETAPATSAPATSAPAETPAPAAPVPTAPAAAN